MSSRLRFRGLCVALMVSLMPPPVAAEPGPESAEGSKEKPKEKSGSGEKSKKGKGEKKGEKKSEKKESGSDEKKEARTNAPLDPETPTAGDENIPDDPVEPGQIGTGRRKTGGGGGGPSLRISRATDKGVDAIAVEFDTAASLAFDAGDYREAARLWVRGLEALPENESNHVMRSAMLMNAVTAYEQLYVESGDVEMLKRAQLVVGDYLKACKKRWGNGCDRLPETADARKRMEELLARIDSASPKVQKIPPEIDTAPGGRSFNRMVKLPPAPAWIGPTFAGGLALIGGGVGLLYFARTDDRFKTTSTDQALAARVDWRSADTDTTGADTTSGGDTTSGTSGSSTTVTELAPETKRDICVAFGTVAIAAGIGLVVLASLRLARHRRINRERSSVLTWSPTLGPSGGGVAVSGRF